VFSAIPTGGLGRGADVGTSPLLRIGNIFSAEAITGEGAGAGATKPRPETGMTGAVSRLRGFVLAAPWFACAFDMPDCADKSIGVVPRLRQVRRDRAGNAGNLSLNGGAEEVAGAVGADRLEIAGALLGISSAIAEFGTPAGGLFKGTSRRACAVREDECPEEGKE